MSVKNDHFLQLRVLFVRYVINSILIYAGSLHNLLNKLNKKTIMLARGWHLYFYSGRSVNSVLTYPHLISSKYCILREGCIVI